MALHVFTYGTSLPGQANAALLAPFAGRRTEATVTGLTLCSAPGVSYPFAVEQADGQIRGAAYEFADRARRRILTSLDHLEGFDPQAPARSLYLRRNWTAVTATVPQRTLPVVVYIAGPAAPRRLVELGVTRWTERRLV